MFIHNILILFLASAFIKEARSSCKWSGFPSEGQPGKPTGRNEQPKCRDTEDAYRTAYSYEAICDKIIDLDIKPCYIDNYGFHEKDNYIYSLDIIVANAQTHDLFAQNLNSYRGLQVRKLQINKGDNITTVPQEIFDLNHLEYLDLSNNNIRNIQITSFALIPGLDYLDLSLNEITDLNPIPVDVRSNVTDLHLNYNRIKTFPVHFLYYFPKLEKLHLDNNQIEFITLTDFEGEINLKNLDLSNNKLTSINCDGLRKLSHSLEYLEIQFNSITKLPTKNDFTFPELEMLTASYNQIEELDSFENFPKVFSIQLGNNKITKITRNIFKTNKELKWLTLDNNPIADIESNSFEQNTKLFHMDMQNTSLVLIEGSIFYGFNNEDMNNDYIEIDLRKGKIIKIGDDAFTGVNGLLSLYLSSNAIENISSLAFNTLDSLKKLDISHNQLEIIDFKTNNLKKLEEFYAHHNKIEKISKSVFENLISLKILDLSFNNIKETDSNALANLKDLYYINFSNNKEFDVMTTTPLSELGNLEEFQLAETGITTFKNGSITYCDKSSRTTLNASFSKIKTIEYNAFGNSECLRYLILSNNELELFQVNITSIKNLEELLLDNNHIRNINSDTFNNLNKLSRIHLQNNDIVHVDPNAFENVPKLEYLYISSTVTPRTTFTLNGLTHHLVILSVENFDFQMNFEEYYYRMYKLSLKSCGIKDLSQFRFSNILHFEELYLSDNDISVVNHDKLKELSSLWVLDLSKNKISSIPAGTFANMTRLRVLDLSQNKISALPKGIFEGAQLFRSLNLSRNSLDSFDFKILPPTTDLYLDYNPITSLNFNDAFDANITIVSVGHSVSCNNLLDVKKSFPENFNKIVTADPLNKEVQNVNGIPC